MAIGGIASSAQGGRKLLARLRVCISVNSTHILDLGGPGSADESMSPIIGFDSSPRTRVVFGINSVERLGELAREVGGRSALLVTGAGIVAAGHAEHARRALEAAGVTVTVFDRVRKNPTTRDVDACLEVARVAQIELLARSERKKDTARWQQPWKI
jgi:hypothetical protein